MARKYKSTAHAIARNGAYQCAQCDRDLGPAKYGGEFTHTYDNEGNEKMVSVFLTCQRCGCINCVSIDITDNDGFMNTVDSITSVPHRAMKITTAPEMAEETA